MFSLNCVLKYRAVGIVLLVVILAALLVLGCWYFKKRSGYKIIRVRPSNQYNRHSLFLRDIICAIKQFLHLSGISIQMMGFTHVKMVI